MSDDSPIWSDEEPVFATPHPQSLRDPATFDDLKAQKNKKKYTSIRSDYYGHQNNKLKADANEGPVEEDEENERMSDISDGEQSESSSSNSNSNSDSSSSSSDSQEEEIEQSRKNMIAELRQIEEETKQNSKQKDDIDQKEQLIMNPEDMNMKADHQVLMDNEIRLKKFIQIKEYAKNFFVMKNYDISRHKYLQSIALCNVKEEISTLYSNMAMCSIKSEMWEQGFDDVQNAISYSRGCDQNPQIMIKMKYRLAVVLANLREYEQAKNILKHLKKYCNLYEQIDLFKQTNILFDKMSSLINNLQGKFRLQTIMQDGKNQSEEQNELAKSKRPQSKQIDIHNSIADYFSHKIVISTNQKGRCVLATQDIQKGELVMVCQSFCSVKSNSIQIHQELNQTAEVLSEKLMKKQRANPRTFSIQVSQLSQSNILLGTGVQRQVISVPSLSTYNASFSKLLLEANQTPHKTIPMTTLKDIVKLNSFSSSGGLLEDTQEKFHNLFLMASFFNHSCEPNIHQSFMRQDSSVLFLKASRDIQQGEELLITYLDPLMSLKERQDELKLKYGFNCQCQRCIHENSCQSTLAQFDTFLKAAEAENIINQNSWSYQQVSQNISKVVDGIQKMSLESQNIDQKQFINPYEILALFKLLILIIEMCDVIPIKCQEDQNQIFGIFEKVSFALLYSLGHSDGNVGSLSTNQAINTKYPGLLMKAIVYMYRFKSRYTHSDMVLPQREERLFSTWEFLNGWLLPQDWYDSTWLFTNQIKTLYEVFTNEHPGIQFKRTRELQFMDNI